MSSFQPESFSNFRSDEVVSSARELPSALEMGLDQTSSVSQDWDTQSPLENASEREAGRVYHGDLLARLDKLQRLKQSERTLRALGKELDAIIKRYREAVLPATLQIGLSASPNEILTNIIGQLRDTYDDRFAASRFIIRDLSVVSKHFRQIVLAFTRVWTYLDLNLLCTPSVDLLVLRSKGAPLSVKFKSTPDLEPTLLRALELKDRWCHLDADFGSDIDFFYSYSSLTFPSVTTLRLRFEDEEDQFDEADLNCACWKFPNADDVEIHNHMLLAGICVCKAATRLSIVTECNSYLLSDPFAQGLAKFSGRASTLQSLYLNIHHVIGELSDDPGFKIDLPSVTTFSVTNECPSTSGAHDEDECTGCTSETYAQVVGAMNLPNVQNISLVLGYVSEWDTLDLGEWLSIAFPQYERMQSVSNLAFSTLVDDYGSVMMDEFFKFFPSLRSLSVDAEGGFLDFRPDLINSLKTLRSLCIRDTLNNEASLNYILKQMVEKGARFEDIDIQAGLRYSVPKFRVQLKNSHSSQGWPDFASSDCPSATDETLW